MGFLEKLGIPKVSEKYKAKTVFDCNLCKDTGWVPQRDRNGNPVIKRFKTGIEWIEEKPCKCQLDRAKSKKLEETGLKSRFDKNNIDNFLIDSTENKVAVEKFNNFIANYEMNTLVIQGKTGTGKTHLALSAINEIMKVDNSFAKIVNFGDLLNELKQAMRFNEEDSEMAVLKKYREAKILLIDDLFKLNTDTQTVKWMLDIINHRYNEREAKRFTTIITSEHTLMEIYKLDGALGGRLIEMAKANVINLKEKNRRLK